jgi:TetR/AcrR family transcriptional regulator, mexJK operon transcriptional repressor
MPKIAENKYEYHRQKSLDKAEQILSGALPEFLKHGYARTSMDRVALAAGVSKQTLYSHFRDKDGLFTALVQYMACEEFRLVWAQTLQGEPKQVLQGLAYRIIKEVGNSNYLDFARMIIAESKKRPDLCQIFVTNLAQPAMKVLTGYLTEHPELKIADPEAIARIFVGSLIHLIMTQEMFHGKEFFPIEEERIVNNLINLIVKN